jgi:hypothetical protein
MTEPRPIAVIQGAATPVVQALMRQFIARLDPGVRVVGVVEAPLEGDDDGCSAGELKSLGDGRRFGLQQELGANLVVLSKFGKVEAERSGLAPALARAMELGAPVLTSVAPKFNEAWDRFAAPYYKILPPDLAAIEAWWDGARAAATADASAGDPAR